MPPLEAVVLSEYGGLDKLRLEQVPPLEIGAGEILIRSSAAGVQVLRYRRQARAMHRAI
jgi:NADPH:quinone reductase-like Zn-dependent oxidoreductase